MSCLKRRFCEALGCVIALAKAFQFFWKAYANNQPIPGVVEGRKAKRTKRQP